MTGGPQDIGLGVLAPPVASILSLTREKGDYGEYASVTGIF